MSERTILFIVFGSPDPQTLDALLAEDLWSARGLRVAVEFASAVPGMRPLSGVAESVEELWPGEDVFTGYRQRVARGPLARRVARKLGLAVRHPDEHLWSGAYWRDRFAELDPALVVVGTEALPGGRWAVLAAIHAGIPTVQLQHGLPNCWWGYVPAIADRYFTWGPASTRRLVEWGVEPERAVEVGSPRADAMAAQVAASDGTALRRDLRVAEDECVLALVQGYRGLPDKLLLPVASMLAAVLAADDSRRLVIKTHPAESPEETRAIFGRLMPERGLVRTTVTAEDLPTVLAASDVVLVGRSTAGLEAAAAGLPVLSLDAVPTPQNLYGDGIPVATTAGEAVHALKDLPALAASAARGVQLQLGERAGVSREGFFAEAARLIETHEPQESDAVVELFEQVARVVR